MFFNDPNRTYTILGVYHVTRSEHFDQMVLGRGYSSLGFRLRGSSRFRTANGIQNAESGSIIYIPRGVGYHRRSDGEEEMIILHLTCHSEDDDEISILSCPDAEMLFWRMFEVWESVKIGRYHRCASILHRLFETLEVLHGNTHPKVPSAILDGVEHLLSHYRDFDLSIAQLASLSHVSEVYFRKLYQATYGESPWQTVLRLRFDYAAECLTSGYYTVKEVAANAGFSDLKHFRTAFTKHFGISPTQYALQSK